MRISATGTTSHRGGLGRVFAFRAARIAFAGATSGAVDFAAFNVLLLVVIDAGQAGQVLVANTLAFACAMLVNYSMNARFTFGLAASRRSMLAYALFTGIGLVFYNANLLWIRSVLDAETTLVLNVSKVAAMGLLVIWNVVGYDRFVFGPETRASRLGGSGSFER